ncbi:MAG TPA: response regulator transcription factor [Gemmatimonadaceae bacterium]|jgi:DNA-binding NarL/FixJ family response regulator
MTGDTIRVMLADDHQVVRTGLRAVLGAAKDIVVVAEAANGEEATALSERIHPDVIVMDVSMGEMDGLEATRRVLTQVPRPRVLILTMHDEEEYLAEALRAGAAGYLVKSAAHHELVTAVRAVAYGEIYVRPSAAQVLAKRMRSYTAKSSDRARFERLTERERDVLRLVAGGYSAPDIGGQLEISPKTVDTYKQRINEKLGVSSRPEYVRFALRLGLLVADAPADPMERSA